ncbi:MAG: OmpA family protein [Spirochaetota bacterium]|nr:OmpA family protein [Spirochaetota bacterium]
MMKKILLIIYALVLYTIVSSHKFQFKDEKNDEYFIRTYSIQEILINNVLKDVMDLKYEGHLKVYSMENSGANISGMYYYYIKPYHSSMSYRLENSYSTNTKFNRTKEGRMLVSPNYYFPVVRHVPTFPNKDLKIGDTWIAKGEEVQDLKRLGISRPYIMPFTAHYRYLRDEMFRAKKCAIFEVIYIINLNNEREIGKLPIQYPARIMGYFKGNYYWDVDEGYPVYYEGEYNFIYTLMSGQINEYKGIDYGDVKKTPIRKVVKKINEDKNIIKKDLEKKLKDNNLNFPIHEDKNKITINLGELLFNFNSAKLSNETIKELDKLAKLLMKYDNFNLTVEGHTDSIGSDSVNKVFSEKRAKNVRDYLVEKGLSPDKIKFKGHGKNKPIGSNSTPEGRSKNRRVEIIIHTDN